MIGELFDASVARLKDAGVDSAVFEVKYILKEIFGFEYCGSSELDDKKIAFFHDVIKQRCERKPMQYIFSKTYFFGYEFDVSDRVFIPRFETEILVDLIVRSEMVKKSTGVISILDLCSGSGNISLTLAKEIENCHVVGVDISEDAVLLARRNARKLGVENRVDFIQGDLFSDLGARKFDIIVSNPPYVESVKIKELPKEVQCDPVIALDGGADGYDFYRRINAEYKSFLKKNGLVFMEIGQDQSRVIKNMFTENVLDLIVDVHKDLNGYDRVICVRCGSLTGN